MVNLASVIDHTLLSPTAGYNDFKRLCEEAVSNGFYSVCVPPYIVQSCKKALIKTEVKVCTVVGFPLGYSHYLTKIVEAKQSIFFGADEIDAVINISALKSGDFKFIGKEIELLRKAASDKILKIIVETAYLTREEKIKIAKIVLNNGADFIKTSTGFASSGADVEDIKLFKSLLKNNVKIKAAGGIGTYAQAEVMIKAGANRIGSSKSLSILNNNEKNNS